MKTRSTRIAPVTNQIPRMAPATARGIETQPLMKTRLPMLKLLIILCCAFATTAVFGQTIYTWTNNAAVADLGTAANWNPNGVPFIGSGSVAGDTMLFDGQTAGPVSATSNGGAQTGSSVGNAEAGIWVHLTANQVSPVTFHTTVANAASTGIRFNSITIDAGAGSFTLGKNSTTNCLDTLWGTSNPSGQGLTNNSVNPAYILPDVRWRLGAGGAHTFTFGGTGDWRITNDIANVNGAASLIAKDGPGTMYWTAGKNSYWGTETTISTPMTLAGGTLVLQSSGLFPATTTINTTAGALLKLDVVGGSQTIANPVNGGGSVQVNNGTLTLSGQNTYTGNTILSGGSLVANRAENLGANGPLGNGGFISFTGGTLVFSSVNTYDYSPRFTNSASQSFRFDTAGQNVTFTNAIVSTGGTLTKLGSGTLTLTGANTYDGATTVSAGKLVIQGSQGNGAITVANSAALGANQGGQQITPSVLTVGSSSSATLEFNNVNSATTPAIVAGTLAAGGTITVNIGSGSFLIGTPYPLLQWTNGSFTASSFALGTVTGAGGNLTVSGNTLYLNVTALASTWTGNADAIWSATSGALDWKAGGSPSQWINGAPALFDDTILNANTNVTLGSTVVPNGVTVNNNTEPYSITSSAGNVISGSTGLTKTGNGSLTLAGGVNTYTGPTTLNGGITSVGVLAPGGSPSDIGQAGSAAANLVLNGGTLQYTGGGATIDRLFTLGTGGGTIDDEGGGSLVLNNSGSIVMNGTGARTLTLAGTGSDELDAKLGDNGGATALTKSGAGTWIVTGNNTNSGAVTITGGTLQVGNGGATGSVGSGNININPAGSTLSYNRSGTVTNGTITGTGAVTVDGGGTVVLPANNNYGTTTVNGGSTLQVGIGGATGQLNPNGAININDGTLIFNTTGAFAYGGNGIAGGGNLIVRGGGKISSLGANSYSGWTRIDPGSTFQPCQGNTGQLLSSVVTNNGTLWLSSQNGNPATFIYPNNVTGTGRVWVDIVNLNPGWVQLNGSNDYTGGTFIGGGSLVLGDNATTGSGSIVGGVVFTNTVTGPATGLFDVSKRLIINRSDEFTFAGDIISAVSDGSTAANSGSLRLTGSGMVTLTGNNSYPGDTIIDSGMLQVGNGGTSGSIGSGAVTDNGTLIFNRSGNIAFTNVISGGGSLVKEGSGTLTIITNSYSGTTTVSNGTLVINGDNVAASTYVAFGTLGGTGTLYGPVTLDPGTTLAPGASVGTLTINSDLSIGGNVAIEVDKSLPQSNDLVAVSGVLQNTGTGTLTVANLGPALAVGDKFTLFSQPVLNGAALTVIGGGATWTNNLVDDGSISVIGFVSAPILNFTKIGNSLQFTWTGSFKLQAQTNSLNVGIRSNWGDYPGGGTSPITVPIDATQATVFFRLAPAP
jgi:fibronectin-binding autotransporter adhesin